MLSFLDHWEHDDDAQDDQVTTLFAHEVLLADDQASETTRKRRTNAPNAKHESIRLFDATTKRRPRRQRPSDFNPNRVREERKRKLIDLRNKAIEIDRQLQELKSQASPRPRL